MLIVKELLKEKGACQPGMEWFTEHFPGGGNYQAVLNKCADTNQPSYAAWALTIFGPTDSVLEIDSLEGENFFFAGTVKVAGSITLTGNLKAGRNIEVTC